ncbi:MAG: tRNA preQ1(34) S-adenosylmethionine ribosyltransferase-isomerase QueA [Deltaproteobacteria bacterium]|nr:tRNA preQ1(34) S-adenosylmethionine ribosyltransferase-isomerase QueA [Deltaproteobacteria bacterium]MBW2536150.1 tRNA preQ1(34) S-adenosylmethionine ribosyltransferase-isomerase QueA [Deltaproteobacteria bacterium]
MRVDALQYELPAELIARYPTPERDGARLLVVGDRGPEHRAIRDLPSLLPEGALLVVNDSRVIPARLTGKKAVSGGKVELLLVEHQGSATVSVDGADLEGERWSALGRSTGRLRPGLDLELGAELVARILARDRSDGTLQIVLYGRAGGDVATLVEQLGVMPLPPYLGRPAEPSDRDRYQTVYAQAPGAVAAPTAGLHFSDRLLDELAARGVERTAITLHVGPGTFRPVSAEDLDEHPMHAERYVVPPDAAAAIDRARRRGRPVVAVGTTVVRTLEAVAEAERPGRVRVGAGTTRLLIQPGHRFRVVDGLLTNFHLPGSTLLALVYAFRGADRVRAAYEEAIRRRYRFYSYGDAMYLPPEPT